MKILLTFILCLLITEIKAEEHDHGFVMEDVSGQYKVWNKNNNAWSDIESFWLDFAVKNDAKSWGKSATYPKYDDVEEFDTFVVELKQGTCLMQFFHSRWRRANDVQRWHDAFNDYGGCPYVFD